MSENIRKAALLMHGLSDKDRAWMLHQLPIDIRKEIEPLIQELQFLGFQSDYSLQACDLSVTIEDNIPSLQERDVQHTALEEPELVTPIERLKYQPASSVANWMKDESEWVVAQILMSNDWPWMDVCLSHLENNKRQRIRGLLGTIPAIPKVVMNRLLERLVEKLDDITSMTIEMDVYKDNINGEKWKSRLMKWLRSFKVRV